MTNKTKKRTQHKNKKNKSKRQHAISRKNIMKGGNMSPYFNPNVDKPSYDDNDYNLQSNYILDGGRRKKVTRKDKSKTNHKQKGGQNVGDNNTDPSLSIFNSNFLRLFPYKPAI